MRKNTRPAPEFMRFLVFSREEGRHKRLGHVNLSASEGFDPLTLKSHPAVDDIEKATYYLKQLYMRRQACGVDINKHRLRVELSES